MSEETKEELVKKISYMEEELDDEKRRNSLLVEEMEETKKNMLPMTISHHKAGMFYFRDSEIGYKCFAIGRRDVIVIDQYRVYQQVYKLPKEYIVKVPCL